MAIPTSGNISIKSSAGTCRSICAAVVEGGGTASGSLSTLSISAGSPYSSSPYCMREFYGYAPSPPVCVNFSTISSSVGSTACDNTCLARSPYCVSTCFLANFCMWVDIYQSGSPGCGMGCVRLICNGLTIFSCRVAGFIEYNCSWIYARNVDYNDTFCIITCTSDYGYFGPGSLARVCLNTVTNVVGNFEKCTPNCVLTASGILPH